MDTPKILVIVGPTASGKTSLSVELAERFNDAFPVAYEEEVPPAEAIRDVQELARERIDLRVLDHRRDLLATTLAFVILGGSRSWLGPVLGGLLLTALPELLRPVGDLRLVLFGLVILLGPVLFPQGLVTPALLEHFGRWKP